MGTAVCRPKKMAHFTPTTQTVYTDGIVQILIREVVRLHGVPRAIVGHRDTRLTSDIRRTLCNQLDIKQRMSASYHPQTDGQSERTNHTIEQMLRRALRGDDTKWAAMLPSVG